MSLSSPSEQLSDISDMVSCAYRIGLIRSLTVILAGGMFCACCGCWTTHSQRLHQALFEADPFSDPGRDGGAEYRLGAGDVIEVRFARRADWSGTYRILPHGCIVLPEVGAVPLTGLTVEEATERIAQAVSDSPSAVAVKVVRFESQAVYLIGEIQGGNRAIPYQGPETIVELLRRAGGLTADADATAIRVHRSSTRNSEEEVIRVNLHAVLEQRDGQQNIHIQPFDRVVVPRNKWACLRDCLPGFWPRLFAGIN